MPTVVLNLTQKISAIIRPLRQSLPSERSLRSAHRGVRRSQLHCVSAGAAKTPYPQPPSSFPNCDRCAGSQFGTGGQSRPPLQNVSARCRLPAIIKIACGAASEEASCIPLPPRRRKLHIRWLLLPFQTVTAALGHSLGIRVHFRFRRFSFFSSPGLAVLFFLKKRKKRMGAQKPRAGNARPYDAY